MMHRIGVVSVLRAGLWLAWGLVRTLGLLRLGLVAGITVRFLLGMGNVLLFMPLPVAHNAGAALQLTTLVWINHRLAGSRT